MKFPPTNMVSDIAATEYEKDFVFTEYEYGLENYLTRIDRLMFKGRSVLDAGSGVGQWSLALAQRFARVAALDLKPERLKVMEWVCQIMGINNISSIQGSVEELPFEDQSFSAIFCYGVIMFTDIRKTLQEFFRVLEPGGRVYLCLNGEGWSRYLINEMGKNNPAVKEAGRKTLYDTFWGRALKDGIVEDLRKDYTLVCNAFGHKVEYDEKLCSDTLINRPTGQKLLNHVIADCGEEYRAILLQDVADIINEKIDSPLLYPTRAYMPDELERIVKEAGFSDFQWAVESGLVCNWLVPPCEPKYQGHYGQDISVWECMFTKPESLPVDLAFFPAQARNASCNGIYMEYNRTPVVSNRSPGTFPFINLEQARLKAQRLGGQDLLNQIVQQLLINCSSQEEAVRSIITFVQKAIYRDPISQPINPDGSLPDSAVTLLCSRGRCGHVSRLIVDLCSGAGIEARITQLPNHVIAEVKVDDRWVVADGDFFKHGIIPVNRQGKMLSLSEINENPYQLDRFPPTGLLSRPVSDSSKGVFGYPVTGYVDALEPPERGFVSGYYVEKARGIPPGIPVIESFGVHKLASFLLHDSRVQLKWQASTAKLGTLRGYRVYVGSQSRGWNYNNPMLADSIESELPCDILKTETIKNRISFKVPPGINRIYASVVPYTNRIKKEPETYFWPSEEAVCEF